MDQEEYAATALDSAVRLANAVERIADALERAHPPLFEWVAADQIVNDRPGGTCFTWTGPASEENSTPGREADTLWRRPFGSEGPWERVR